MAKKQSQKKRVAPPKPTPKKKATWLKMWRFGLSLIALLLYVNTIGHEYALDDAIVITQNDFVQQGIAGLPDLFSGDTFLGFFGEQKNLVAGGRYRPLTLATFAIEQSIFGGDPHISHAINALLYALCVWIIFETLLLLLSKKVKRESAIFIAGAATLLFAIHPLHTEAVANIKGRDEIMTMLFAMTTLYSVARSVWENKLFWLIGGAVAFIAALFCKENAAPFVVLIPLALWLFGKTELKKLILPTGILFGGFLIYFAARTAALGGLGFGDPSLNLMNNPFVKLVGNQWELMTFLERLPTILYTWGKYIQLIIFPWELTHDYYPRHVRIYSWGDWQVIVSLLVYLGGFGYAAWRIFNRKIDGYGILFYLLTFSIVSNLVFAIGTTMGERFVFMPLLGLCVFGAYWLERLYRKLPWAALGFLLIALLADSVHTIWRNTAWKNNKTLFLTDVKISSNSAKLCNAVAGEYSQMATAQTDLIEQKRLADSIIVYADRAIEVYPSYANAWLLRGNGLTLTNRYEEAIQSYDQALVYKNNFQDAINNKIFAMREAGQYYGQRNEIQKAENYLQNALALRSNDIESMRMMGIVKSMQQDYATAFTYFNNALAASRAAGESESARSSLYDNMATAYAATGQAQQAAEYQRLAQAAKNGQ